MAEGIGVEGLHCISGTCDLCGEACDANTQELNVLSCTFKNCEDLPYHQDCLEKYLKSIRLERNRKTGFKCPRGCGKGTQHSGPCPGKIDKSHPIHPRNEEQKKKKKANLPAIMAAAPVRVIKTKEEKKAEKERAKAAAAAEQKAAEQKAKAAAAAKPATSASSAAAASSSKASKQQQPDPKKLAEAAAALRREIATNKASKQLEQAQAQQQHRDASPSQPEYKTLDAYLRENSIGASSSSSPAAAGSAAPVANAWAKPPAPAPHALSGAAAQQRHRPAEASRASPATARDLSPVSPAAAAGATTPRGVPPAGPGRPAAAAGAGLPPIPQPPPPPAAPAAAGQQAHGMHPAPSIHSHPLASQGSTVSLVSQASAGANGQLPVGAEYVGEDGQGLTKAQRKNLKRAEKKKQKETGPTGGAAGLSSATGAVGGGSSSSQSGSPAAAAAAVSPGASHGGNKLSRLSVVTGGVGAAGLASGGPLSLSRRASSTSDSLAAAAAASAGSLTAAAAAAAAAAAPEDEDSVALMYELAVHAMLAKKTLALVASLQRLGFAEWQAAAAVQRHGSDLEDAVAWLLDGGAPDPEAAAAVSAGCVADVTIVEELRLLDALGAALPHLPRSALYSAVADAGGDLDKAAAAAVAQQGQIVAAAEAALAAAAASNSSPLASASATASPTSTASAQQQHHLQQQHVQLQMQQEQQQHQLPNGLGSSVDSPQYSAFGGPSLSLYASPAAPGALSPAAPALTLPPVAEGSEAVVPAEASSSGFASWFAPATSRGDSRLGANLGATLAAHPLHSLTSTSSLGVGPLDSAGSGFGSYVPGSATAAAAAAMGSNIWGAGSTDAAGSLAGWGSSSAQLLQSQQQPGELLAGGSASLFAASGLDGGLSGGGWGSSGGLTGHSGLGLLGQQGLASAEPALNPYAPFGSGGGGSLFGSSALAQPHAQQQQHVAVSTPDTGRQQSRLFSSYGVSQPQQQQPQQLQGPSGWPGAAGGVSGLPTAPSGEDDDLEGMLATLMCH